MKLYYAKGACSLAVRITLNHLKIPFEAESVDLRTKKTEAGADYLSINPKGSVPALRMNDNQILTENAAILQYLADSTQEGELLPRVGDIKRYRTIEWLNFVSTEVHKYAGSLFSPKIPDNLKQDFFRPTLMQRLLFANHHLENNQFLIGDRQTIADNYFFVTLLWRKKLQYDMTQLPNLTRYVDMMMSLEPVTKSLSEEGLHT